MTAAVWIVGGQPDAPDRDELRHSLRSVAANAPVITEAWIVGDVPDWFAGVRLPLEPKPTKFGNQFASIKALVNLPGAPETFWLMNDDMYVTEPVDGDLPTYRSKNRLSGWLRAEGRSNGWHRAVAATAEWTAERTGQEPYIYEAHVPLRFRTAVLREVVNAYPDPDLFAVGEVYPIAGCGGEGVHAGNAKCKTEALETKLGQPMPYLSGSPGSWNGALGEWVRAQWVEPCRWER